MKIRILGRDDIVALLPMKQAITQMRTAFAELSAGRAVMPLRSRVETAAGDMLLMPACLDQSSLCLKAVLTYPGNRERNLPVVQGAMIVFDAATGTPRALMDCEELTAIRTGAGGGLAVDLLSRPDSQVLGMIGGGVQARCQVQAASIVRDLQKILIFDMNRQMAEAMRDEILSGSPRVVVQVVDDAEQAIRDADIVITATTSTTPTFDGRMLRPGTHVNAIGSYLPNRREVDTYTVEQAYVVVDSREASLHEAGDLIIPSRQPDAELGEVVNGTATGRSDAQQITLFKSVGVAVQDAAAAGWVFDQAEQHDVGTVVDV